MLPESGTAKMIVSARSASRSDLATTVGPLARACGANASGNWRLATVTSMFLRASCVGEGLALSYQILQPRSSYYFSDPCWAFPGFPGVQRRWVICSWCVATST